MSDGYKGCGEEFYSKGVHITCDGDVLCDYCLTKFECEIQDERINKIKHLEQENAELKDKLNIVKEFCKNPPEMADCYSQPCIDEENRKQIIERLYK